MHYQANIFKSFKVAIDRGEIDAWMGKSNFFGYLFGGGVAELSNGR
jgi:hypothetical protein